MVRPRSHCISTTWSLACFMLLKKDRGHRICRQRRAVFQRQRQKYKDNALVLLGAVEETWGRARRGGNEEGRKGGRRPRASLELSEQEQQQGRCFKEQLPSEEDKPTATKTYASRNCLRPGIYPRVAVWSPEKVMLVGMAYTQDMRPTTSPSLPPFWLPSSLPPST